MHNLNQASYGNITDFDLPAEWNEAEQSYISPQLVYDNVDSPSEFLPFFIWQTPAYSNWYNNYGLSLVGQTDYQITELNDYMTIGSVVAMVDNASGFPINGTIQIDKEIISYSFVDRALNILGGLQRGLNGTEPTTHLPGAKIITDLPAVVILDGGKNYIEPPKIRHHSRGQNISLAATPVADLVARTTQAFVVQQQGFARKKSVGDVSVISSAVGVNVDATAGHQITASSSSQSQTGQGSSSSNILEKWADSHLDLSSKGWSANMAKSMVSALNSGRERLMFSLSPPSLGRISIAFASTRGALDVRIQAERKATIALLGDAEGKLTSNLESAGHRVNSLSYAEMNSGEAKFDFNHNQRSNNENKRKDGSDSPESEKSVEQEVGAESSVVQNKKADDSLVNITV